MRKVLLSGLCVSTLGGVEVFGPSGSGIIAGRVTDPSDARVQRASITGGDQPR